MKPFTAADIVKECMLVAGNVLFAHRKDVENFLVAENYFDVKCS